MKNRFNYIMQISFEYIVLAYLFYKLCNIVLYYWLTVVIVLYYWHSIILLIKTIFKSRLSVSKMHSLKLYIISQSVWKISYKILTFLSFFIEILFIPVQEIELLAFFNVILEKKSFKKYQFFLTFYLYSLSNNILVSLKVYKRHSFMA